jgi:predicted PolB exonuclease-like 3'-5' exonuclease
MSQSLVFDIETIPLDFDTSFDDAQKEYLLRGCSTDEEREDKKNLGGLNPLLGKVVCIGTYVQETRKGTALYLDKEPIEEIVTLDDMTHKYKAFDDEAALIQHFWAGITNKYQAVVSFNGRNFDCPFLMLRSAMLGIRPSVNLMAGTRWDFKVANSSERYSGIDHIDLADKLVFGAGYDKVGATRKFNLDFYTRAFGIPSPKAAGITGHEVPQYFAEGRSREIAEYCMRDVRATSDLYEKWVALLKF